MNNHLDEKLKQIRATKESKKIQKVENKAQDTKDLRSGLILRVDTRVAEEDEIAAKANGREFIDIESLDNPETKEKYKNNQQQGFFTIGCLCDKSPILATKGGKKYVLAKLTDLQKYDLDKVQKLVDSQYKSKDDAKNVMKSYTRNGYKQI